MIIESELDTKSNSAIIAELGGRFKTYRIFSNFTQKEIAEMSGVSLFTISQFEKGTAKNITLGTFLSLLRSIGFLEEVTKLLPELPLMPNQKGYKSIHKKERIRHGKQYGTGKDMG